MRDVARTDLLAAMRYPALPAVAATIGLALALAATAGAASFAPGPCPAPETPIPALANARCGFLTVPENRSRPDGRTIRLRVAIVPAQSPTPAPDPVVYLTGGPGGSAISALQNVVNAGANRDRDLIVLEQRGTLYSDPSLTCPVIDRWNSRVVRLPYDARSTGRKQPPRRRMPAERRSAKGADPASYNTTRAPRTSPLRVALGIPEWNVIGASYGTDLALSYMRDHPEGIRSVTIDSVIAPDQAGVGRAWTSAGVGMRQMFQACRAQPRCRRAYPRPGRVFTRLVRRLEARPITAFVKPALIPGDKPEPGAKRAKVVLDGGAFANYIINITGAGFGAKVPKLLYDFAHGRRRPVLASQAATGELHAGELSYGLQYGVVCSEWIPFETERDVLRRGRQAFPGFPRSVRAQPPQFPFRFMDCPVWDVPKAPDSQRAVPRSAIPTLVLAGSFDTLTSEANARHAASNLPSSRLVVIPGTGHVVLNTSKCAGERVRVVPQHSRAPGHALHGGPAAAAVRDRLTGRHRDLVRLDRPVRYIWGGSCPSVPPTRSGRSSTASGRSSRSRSSSPRGRAAASPTSKATPGSARRGCCGRRVTAPRPTVRACSARAATSSRARSATASCASCTNRPSWRPARTTARRSWTDRPRTPPPRSDPRRPRRTTGSARIRPFRSSTGCTG